MANIANVLTTLREALSELDELTRCGCMNDGSMDPEHKIQILSVRAKIIRAGRALNGE